LNDAELSGRDVLFTTNIKNNFQVASGSSDGIVRGLTSNAAFIVNYKYGGDLTNDSGEIVYIENLNPISRNARQTETIRLTLEF
jgi:hypothetical protein